MPQRKPHTYSKVTLDVLRILGDQIAAARRERRWRLTELAERAGISANTLRSIEKGAPTVAIGATIEVAAILGLPLYGDDTTRDLVRAVAQDRLALLGRRVRDTRKTPDDAF
ncbi:helix-turn-helix domain-containing protein [Humibacter sp.]|uniref:helix-turn-helix domain-containing protein n=1 Tax=Humibacter sp. TaxID=1940291 RepID=UPI003F7FB656